MYDTFPNYRASLCVYNNDCYVLTCGLRRMECFFYSKTPHSEEYITLSLPAPPLNLGTPPRLCYPLVIFLLRCDSDVEIHPDETVSLLGFPGSCG